MKIMNKLSKLSLLYRCLFSVLWLKETGHFFYFRSAPDLIVRATAMIPKNGKSDGTLETIYEAKQEWRLRNLARRKRWERKIKGDIGA